MKNREIEGHYFPYCQLCTHDGSCMLRHFEFLGAAPGDGVDATPFKSHEDLAWGYSAFQRDVPRQHCTGRIGATDDVFFPLQCECGTVVSSLAVCGNSCAKFSPTPEGSSFIADAPALLATEGTTLMDVLPDQEYTAEMCC